MVLDKIRFPFFQMERLQNDGNTLMKKRYTILYFAISYHKVSLMADPWPNFAAIPRANMCDIFKTTQKSILNQSVNLFSFSNHIFN